MGKLKKDYIGIRLDPATKKKLIVRAINDDRSLSSYIVKIINNFLQKGK